MPCDTAGICLWKNFDTSGENSNPSNVLLPEDSGNIDRNLTEKNILVHDKKMARADSIWYDDLTVLAKRPLEFFPAQAHTPAEQTNALVRLIIYASAALFAYNRRLRSVWYGLAAVVVVTLLYRGRGGKYAGLTTGLQGAKQACRQPTPENPFANMLVSEYGKELPPPPCEYDDVKDKTEEYFDRGLFKDIDDVYNVNNSQRQFMTAPNGGRPPDFVEFAKFLGKDMQGKCKQDTAFCRGHLP